MISTASTVLTVGIVCQYNYSPPPPHYSVSVSDGIDGGVKYQVLWLAGGCEEAGREGKTNPTNSPLLREVSE